MIVIFLAATMLNQAVTPETIHQTICRAGYARSVRMAPSLAAAIKRRMLLARGITSPKGWVLDHIISLELGGSNDVSNLQLQTREDSLAKDRLEAQDRRDVCDGWLHLRNAQRHMEGWKP